jgi:prophage regulatory protein
MPSVLLRLPEVVRRTGWNATEIYQGMKANPPEFPASVPIGKRSVGWVEQEIEEWIARRIAQRDAQSLERSRLERRRKGGPGRGKTGPMRIETTEL